jgi:transcriptional regulator of acetoin/glycerol metabolism
MTDRTLTAVQSALSEGERPDTPVLLVMGSADMPGLPPRARLVIIREDLEIGRRPAPEARSPGNTLPLADALVSSRHARVVRTSTGAELEDLQSKNGTFVDNHRVESGARVPLQEGALLFFGQHVAVFRLASPLALEAIRHELVDPFGPVATASPALATACDRLRRLAGSDSEIFLVGETGVGKEVYARAVHVRSGRKGRFVAINCGALPRDLVESELFGYRPGAHSTAHQAKAGLIEEAEGGTLFLDEIGEMSHEAQIKLLRFLQDRELTPLGATRPRRIDVRIVAATNRLSEAGRTPAGLRDDIVARLGAAPIFLPPLRERKEDLGALAAHFLRAHPGVRFEEAAFRALALHDWPLNVRELEKVVTTAAILTGAQKPIALRDLPEGLSRRTDPAKAVATPPPVSVNTGSPTPARLQELLARHEGNVADVARELGKHRAAVWRWIKKFGIAVAPHRRMGQADEAGAEEGEDGAKDDPRDVAGDVPDER